jgi:hypothetical protein
MKCERRQYNAAKALIVEFMGENDDMEITEFGVERLVAIATFENPSYVATDLMEFESEDDLIASLAADIGFNWYRRMYEPRMGNHCLVKQVGPVTHLKDDVALSKPVGVRVVDSEGRVLADKAIDDILLEPRKRRWWQLW